MKTHHIIKKEHFQNLVAVAVSDGLLDDVELDFLSEKAIAFGITKDEVKEIMTRADQLEFEVPLNNVDREEQLSDVVFISMVDGQVAEKEYNLCLKIAQKLEFDKKELDHIIALTKELWEKEQ